MILESLSGLSLLPTVKDVLASWREILLTIVSNSIEAGI